MKKIVIGSVVAIIGAVAMARSATAYEEPSYKVVVSIDDYEIRQYDPYLVAETTVGGDYDDARSRAFRLLAGYIFGNNQASKKMQMTIPVTMITNQGESMKMTAPVEMTSENSQRHNMRFVIERKYSMDTLPRPNDDRVKIREMPARTIAVLRYSGRTTRSNFESHREKLLAKLAKDGHKVVGEARSAVFNGPWTLPFMRRNEVQIEILDPVLSGQ